ncbi:response regulator [Rhodoferax aquaticus]|uniref:Response regulator transcription factor n=1 Tax=Rhodoferax aquaticus TaxID=2527691 RepID=A0A515EPB6_9BURK|nr:response regulator transcription factor [Rhodoferax aquaticus]QDL54470.1 response regulator transcription factor [Rhodoferax aquaticus]
MQAHHFLLIDDHAMFRAGLALVLAAEFPGVHIVEAGDLAQAMQLELSTPDVVLLDVQLQGLSGLECISILKRKWPNSPIVMLSGNASSEVAQTALARGASAFLSKMEKPAAMISVIRQQLSGEAVLEKTLTQPSSNFAPLGGSKLTGRQLEVLNLLAQGLPNKAIGKQLELSENTVRGHVQALLSTLQVASRTEAVFAAKRGGLID